MDFNFSADGRTLVGADLHSSFVFDTSLLAERANARQKAASWQLIPGWLKGVRPPAPYLPLTATIRTEHHSRGVVLTPDGRNLLYCDSTGAVRMTHVASGRDRTVWQLPIRANSLAVAADGLTAAAGSRTGRVVVWDLDV